MKDCFVIMPIGRGEQYDIHKNRFEHIIRPAVEEFRVDGQQVYNCVRADFISRTGSITRTVIQRLYSSEVVIADLTELNPNVFYELGVRHALSNKTILLALKDTSRPFDIADLRVIEYEDRVGGANNAIRQIQEMLLSFLEDYADIDSPVMQAIPQMREMLLRSPDDDTDIDSPVMQAIREITRSLSLIIVPPERPSELRNLDLSRVQWETEECYLTGEDWSEKVKLVRSQFTNTFIVHISASVMNKINYEEPLELSLKDKKGNRWAVESFYLLRKELPLSVIKDLTKIQQDYGEEDQ